MGQRMAVRLMGLMWNGGRQYHGMVSDWRILKDHGLTREEEKKKLHFRRAPSGNQVSAQFSSHHLPESNIFQFLSNKYPSKNTVKTKENIV